MHNGMMETLEEVIDFYSNPYEFVATPINMDTTMLEPLNFTDQQKTDLVNFLHSLTDISFLLNRFAVVKYFFFGYKSITENN